MFDVRVAAAAHFDAARDCAMNKKTTENWNTERGILDGIHRIREELEQERQLLGDAAYATENKRIDMVLKIHPY